MCWTYIGDLFAGLDCARSSTIEGNLYKVSSPLWALPHLTFTNPLASLENFQCSCMCNTLITAGIFHRSGQ